MTDSTNDMNDSVGSESTSDEEEDFSSVQKYFTDAVWSTLSPMEKTVFLNQKKRYDVCHENGVPITLPNFMVPKQVRKRKRPAGVNDTSSSQVKRRSTRQTTKTPVNSTAPDVSLHELVENNVEEDDPFTSIRPFYTPNEWAKLSIIVKRHALMAKESYDEAVGKGLSPEMPPFMLRKNCAIPSTTTQNSSSSGTNPSATGTISSSSGATLRAIEPSSSCIGTTSTATATISSSSVTSGPASFFDEDTIINYDLDMDQNNRPVTPLSREQGHTEDFGVYVSANPNELADEIRGVMADVLPNARNDSLLKIADYLVAQGVESMADLSLVQQDWLQGFDLNPIQVKKVLKAFSQLKLSARQKKIVSTTAESDNTSEPTLMTFNLTTDVMGNFTFSFSKLRESLLRSLEKKQEPSPQDREHFVLAISREILCAYDLIKAQNPTLKQKTPGRVVYRAVVDKVFEYFRECFEDKLKGKVLGDGKFSLADQIETCVENLKRSKGSGPRSVSATGNRRAACILPEKFSPHLTKVEKANGEGTRKELAAMYNKNEAQWDWNTIRSKMTDYCSFGAQRDLINSKTRNMHDIMEKWPFLFELQGMLIHMEEVTGSSLLDKFEIYVDNEMERTMNFMTTESPKRVPNLKLERNIRVCNGVHKKLVGVILMVANHFGEDQDLIIKTVKDTTLPHEVEVVADLPSTPCIVALGASPFSAKTFYVCMEKVVVSSALPSGLEALVFLCAVYFVFGVLYPPQANAVLTYLERIVACLEDSSGLLKAQTPAGSVARSALNKVKQLEKAVTDFEKSLNGDD